MAIAADPADAGRARGDGHGLRRAIGPGMLLVFVVGDVLGAGIYALVGEVAAETGGAVWTAFAVALALATLTACSYAELVTRYPQAAGAALYVNRAFRRPFVSFMVAFTVMASGVTSAATLARASGGDYLQAFVDVPTVAAALVFVAVVAAINHRGIAESIRVNLALTCVELGGLLLIAIIAIGALADGGGDPGRAFTFKEGEAAVAAMVGGAALAFYALIGFEDSVNVAEETRDPRKAYPRALLGGLAVAGAVYVVVAILASMVVPTDRLASSSGPLLEVAGSGPLAVDDRVFSAIALFALANGGLINLVMASRLLYGMANEGILPPVLGRVHPTRRTPTVAILVTAGLAMLLVVTGDLSDLAELTVFLLLGVFTMVNVVVLVLRREPAAHDHFRTPTALPVLAALTCLYLMVFETEGDVVRRSLLLLGGGAVLYVVTVAVPGGRRRRAETG